MGKRSDFERNSRDYYKTPYAAVVPLVPYLPDCIKDTSNQFIEPCAGDGTLIRHLEKHGMKCVGAFDIEPQAAGIEKKDVLFFGESLPPCDLIITNPPWERNLDGTGPLHEMITKFRLHAPTWLLFDSDWAYCKQSISFRKYCSFIIPVGRISWMENGKAGMDNCSWYKFERHETQTIFL